ncbi:response regulator [Chromobacterium sphagni]|uniref:Response regulatory domain-containing protein n=1 Tax=Chromobacterium sphagni TaxID=1903179 RepID=A0ABX3C892_9NEIS|nr:response regulator [Chromobacterium sphagni]OHX17245.1 hypothetical protein BI344_20955 [Chromobacterium sphagni]
MEQKRQAGADGENLRVLLVEDSDINRMMVASLLENCVVVLDIVADGAQAVARLRAAEPPYHLVLMDVHMPVMDGYDATRIIRQELGLTLPIVALTAGSRPHERERCREAGMDGFLAKPVDGEQLLALLARLQGSAPAITTAPDGNAQAHLDWLKLDTLDMLHKVSASRLNAILLGVIVNSKIDFEQAFRQWESGDFDIAARLVHRYRGSLGTFVDDGFVRQALELENAIAEAAPDVEQRFARLRLELDQLLAQLKQWLAAHAG